MTAHSLQELSAVLATKGKETTRPKGDKKIGECTKPPEAPPPNYCVVCGGRIKFYYPYGRWVDKRKPQNLHAGTCSARCEDSKDPISAAFRQLRIADCVT